MKTPDMPFENTDREIWRGPDEGGGDFYADSMHITKEGALGINCGGRVIVRPIRDWFALPSPSPAQPGAEREEVARIIEPYAGWGGNCAPINELQNTALTKADAILARISPASGGGK